MKFTNRSFGLDFARALAICLVLIAHFVKKVEHFGFWGVELFFGLSGFLIGQILWKSFSQTDQWTIKHLTNFWSRRWWRTLPNYYLFFFIMLLFHSYQGNLPKWVDLKDYLWFGQDFFAREGGFFGISWSLCIEEWFYLLFPLVLFILHKLGLKSKIAFTLTLLLFIATSIFIRQILIADHVGHSLRGITMARLDAIACGVLVVFCFSIIDGSFRNKIIAFSLGLILLLTAFNFVYFSGYSYDEIKESQFTLLIVPLGFSLLLPLTYHLNMTNGAIKWIVEKLSLWSYSIYLSHIPVMFLIYELMGGTRDSIMGNALSKIIGLGLTILVSAIIFTYFEVPLTRKRPKELSTENSEVEIKNSIPLKS
ncbi:acyltransferase 3 [Sporocytophaga myxococcoides]|uniref:Acyltransferase 3 n=1 Tax=Sporocytophaga myxococcoides TaxID=153721 RepID=A0A098LCS6_9BACT|nr:acyltransferase [Sporocytophaga myxococcoides]GAL84058.1 acyltransferase 3 [Sporocytophaga myxococcoides]